MTDDQQATIYGKAMLEHKACKAQVAALVAYFSEYAERLDEARGVVKKFASDPLGIAPDWIALADHAKRHNLGLTRAGFGDQADEFIRIVKRMRELQEQIDKF
jgi:hypothetical protein